MASFTSAGQASSAGHARQRRIVALLREIERLCFASTAMKPSAPPQACGTQPLA